MSEIRNRIKQVRNEKNLTITAVADLFQEKRQRLQDIEGGKQKIPEDVLVKYIEYFYINANWLLTGKGEMYRQQEKTSTTVEPEALGVVAPAAILNRLYSVFAVQDDKALSVKLHEQPEALAKWREQGQVPYETSATVAEQQKISLKWIITGFGDKHSTATIDRRMYIMNQLMEALPDQQQQEILAIIKEKERVNILERKIEALTKK